MTSTMRWLILIPAGPGALIGGWLGEHVSLRAALAFAGVGAVLLAVLAWQVQAIRSVKVLPKVEEEEPELGVEAMPGIPPVSQGRGTNLQPVNGN